MLDSILFYIFATLPKIHIINNKKSKKMKTVQLRREELLREMNPLLDNGDAMRKMTSFVRMLVNGTNNRVGWADAAKRQHAESGDKLACSDVFADESMEDLTW